MENVDLSLCYQCATCSGSCPVARFDGRYNPRVMVLKTLHERGDEVVNSPALWWCLSCYTCQERCPQNIKITEFIIEVQNKSYLIGNAPQKFIKTLDSLRKNGIVSPISGFIEKQRNKLGLNEIKTNKEAAEIIINTLLEGRE